MSIRYCPQSGRSVKRSTNPANPSGTGTYRGASAPAMHIDVAIQWRGRVRGGTRPSLLEASPLRKEHRMWKWIAAGALLPAVVGVAAWQLDRREDRQYRRFCIEHMTDQGRCSKGPAAEARRRCDRGEVPPGWVPNAETNCVQAWLAHDKQ